METLKAIATRHSTRKYTNEQISDKELQILLQAGYAAPCGHNAYGDLHISVIQNAEVLEKLATYCGEAFGNARYNPFYGAPTIIIVSAKPKADGQLVYIADASCVTENIHLAATDIGLGSVFLWAMLHRIPLCPKFMEYLNLPAGFEPITCLAVGYPAVPLKESTLDEVKPLKIATQILK